MRRSVEAKAEFLVLIAGTKALAWTGAWQSRAIETRLVLRQGRQRVTRLEMSADSGVKVQILNLIQRASEAARGATWILTALFYLWSHKMRLGLGPLATESS